MIERPKRKKSKDNPYTLMIMDEKYFVIFKDNKLNKKIVEINEEIFKTMDKFELEDISQMHKLDRHIEHSEVFEETLNKRAINRQVSIEEIVENKILNEELKITIDSLSNIQKRRIKKYYYENKTLEEIAKEENCSKVAVKHSIDDGINKIKKILKK